MNKLIFTLLTILVFTVSSFAQSGSIKGNVKENISKEGAIGATVKIEGTSFAAMTDISGDFEFNRIPAGVYQLSISSIGFAKLIIENIRIEADKTSLITTTLIEDSKMLEGVVIQAQRMTGTEVSVISEIKELKNIAVGISSQQITKTQDRDAAQVVKRVPGVSIINDRFIVIRGLNERYNTVLLNDIITPSTEVDVKSFSFDLIPSSAIDRIMVYKSPSSDLPGDMAGGAIKIYTKTVPDGNNVSFGLTLGARGNTTGTTVLDYQGSNSDFLGFGSGTRGLPANFPSTRNVLTNASSDQVIENFKNLSPYYSAQTKTINPDIRANVNLSRRYFIGSKELTNISYLSYSNTHSNQNVKQNRFFFNGEVQNDFNDQTYANNVRIGAMSNWALILNPKNKIEFRNLFNQLASKETTNRSGNLFENNRELLNQSFRYEQRSIISSQLNGTHELSENAKLKWIGGFGYTLRNEPDFRRFTSSRVLGSNDPFKMDLQQFESPTLQQAARFYSKMDEFVLTGSLNYEQIIGAKNTNPDLNKVLKVGAYTEYKDRYFAARWFGVVNPNRLTNEVLALSPDKFFTNSNLSSSKVYYAEGTNFDDKYTAQNLLAASYANFYLPISENFNASVGFRGEYNRQQLQSHQRGGGAPISVDNPIFSALPSVNAMYKLNNKNILRFGYGTTLNRPEFRELAPFTYYDFEFDVSRRGNKDIKVATIQNFDLRYEIYPGEGELITIGAFYKKFKNPIEAAIFYNGSNVSFTVANSQSAVSSGIELEIRKNISTNWLAVFNGSLINSNVKVSGLSDYSRFLQGQSPYLLNASLFYNLPEKGIQANILYNVIGKRIFVIGDQVLSSNVFEMPRNVIDLNITKDFKKVQIKAGVQDLLNQPFRLIQDTNRDNKITSEDGVYQTYRKGSNFYLGVNYKL